MNAAIFFSLLKSEGLPLPVQEYSFCPQIKRGHYKGKRVAPWRFDFAWPKHKVAIEVQGGIWRKKGAHNTGKARLRDMEKHNAATHEGWRVFELTPKANTTKTATWKGADMHLTSEYALQLLRPLLTRTNG